jgi:UDP-glucose 4-epimerase
LKTVLVTGHSGFLGSNLVSSLNEYVVIGLSTNTIKDQNYKQIKKDIRKVTLNTFHEKIQNIVHLAAVTDVFYCQENPQTCFEINVNGTQNMLEIARKNDSKFLYLSTSHVYGIPKQLLINESHPTSPTSIYSASKIAGEILCESYAKSYGLDVSIIRLFSVYGPHSPQFLVISKIISQILNGNVVKMGNLKPKRDFLYVSDAISAIKLILKKSHGFNIYNVGTGKSHSIQQICDMLKQISGKNLKIYSEKSQQRKNEINDVRADISKISSLGWKPKTDINSGLQQTYQYFLGV